jgi:hypothetical protein
MVNNLSKSNSILNQFVAELRDVHVQTDRLRFRRNMERIGEIMAYEISKTLPYHTRQVENPLRDCRNKRTRHPPHCSHHLACRASPPPRTTQLFRPCRQRLHLRLSATPQRRYIRNQLRVRLLPAPRRQRTHPSRPHARNRCIHRYYRPRAHALRHPLKNTHSNRHSRHRRYRTRSPIPAPRHHLGCRHRRRTYCQIVHCTRLGRCRRPRFRY